MEKQKEYERMNKEIGQITHVDNVFRSTRRQLLPHQSAATSLPSHTYNPQLGVPQFGVPMALNTTVAANAFHQNTGTNGPAIRFRSQQQIPNLQPTKGALGKLFKGNRYCWKCGFQKRFHTRSATPFGDRCSGNCGYEQCSKCNNRLVDFHRPGWVGPHCPNQAAPHLQENGH